LEPAVGQQLGTRFTGRAVTDAGGTIGAPMPARRLAYGRLPRDARAQSGRLAAGRANLFVALLALAGVVLPQEVQISFGAGARFTPGRCAAALLIVPALVVLCKKGRHFVLCDFLAVATASWMIIASASAAGASAIPTAGGDALDFLGGYLIARAYFFGRPALDTFVRVLKVFAIIAVIFGLADSISGRLITHETFSALFGSEWYPPGLRNGWVRAESTFDHPILFGVFCALTAAILLYWEKSFLRRSVAVGFCLLGCLLAQSSASLLTLSLVLAAFAYDQLLQRSPWRWGVFWIAIGLLLLAVFVVTEHPLGWVLSHLTFDPQTGFYRIMIWDAASTYIAQSPWIGHAYQLVNDLIIDATVDCMWLVYGLRFGVPMIILFFLTNISAFFPSRRERTGDPYMDQMRRAFALVLVMFMFTGLTVHFWNYILMFWGICLGIRASFQELA
jgi:hypothetical protein